MSIGIALSDLIWNSVRHYIIRQDSIAENIVEHSIIKIEY